MFLRKTTEGWLAEAPAKLNLYLEVLGRRADGFHEVETLVTPISLYDTLRFSLPGAEDSSIQLIVEDGKSRGCRQDASSDLPPADDKNLVVRALLELRAVLGIRSGMKVHLTKRIPSEAGLGGGSSNAAAALIVGNRLWGGGLNLARLSEIAARIGSDVPLFLRRGASICTGRGEMLSAADVPAGLPVVLAKPPCGLGAGQVYDELRATQLTSPSSSVLSTRLTTLTQHFRTGRYDRLGREMFNRLQQPAAALAKRMSGVNWIERLSRLFDKLPLVAHQLTGSGSVYFGIASNWRVAQRAASALKQEKDLWVATATTIG